MYQNSHFGGRGGRSFRHEGRGNDADMNMKGHGGGPDSLFNSMLAENPDAQLLFVGSVNCLRHKPYLNIGQKMQECRAAILSPSMGDFSSGRYLHQIEEALLELADERNTKDFVIACGCQWVILSTDGDLLIKEMKEKHDINVSICQDDHLEFGDHA